MRTSLHYAAALLLALVACPYPAPATASDGVNWMRDYVRQRELQTMRRALGDRSATETPQPQIVGGHIAKPGRWPFQVALLSAVVKNNADAQYCGGSLIDSRHVLTAAHCVDFLKRPSQLQILTGTQSLASGGTRQNVAAYKFHPKWNTKTTDYDIAVVTLAKPVTGIVPAAMIAQSQEARFAAPGTLVYVTGWGNLKARGRGEYPTELYEVQIPLVSRAVCNAPKSYDGYVTARMICAGLNTGGEDSCDGDSGGPLVVADSTGKYRLQAGIVSWGNGCAQRNFYGVYSRLAVLSSWARTITAASVAQVDADTCDATPTALRGGCFDTAIEAVRAEQRGYLDRIRRDGSPEQSYAVQASQRAWSTSLASLCAFAASNGGELGRKACVLAESRRYADALAQNLAELGQ